MPVIHGVRNSRGTLTRCARVEPLESRSLLSAGDLDPTFGEAGKVTTDFTGSARDRGYGVVLQMDGKYVVAGAADPSFARESGFAVARYNADGSLDATFGAGGRALFDVGASGYATAIALAPDGRIVVAGIASQTAEGPSDFAILRLNPDGSPDTTFDADGSRLIDFGGEDEAWGVAVQPDGRIVIAGAASPAAGGNSTFALTRLKTDGTLDDTFGANGLVITPIGASSSAAFDVALDANGGVIAAGSASGAGTDFALARYSPEGALDATFDADGIVVTSFGNFADAANGVAIASDGKIVAAGYSRNGASNFTGGDFAVARYNVDGSLDTTFDGDGKVKETFTSSDDVGAAVAVDPGTSKVVVVGRTIVSGSSSVAVLRLTSGGIRDNAFSTDGRATGAAGEALGVALTSGGAVVAAGFAQTGDTSDFLVQRFTTTGAADATFGTGGTVFTDFTDSVTNVALAVAVQGDGKTVAGGYSQTGNGAGRDFALARYNSDGSLDATFGTNGRVVTDFAHRSDAITALAITRDGKIVAAGSAINSGTSLDDFALARYNADGSLDTSFGTGGKLVIPFDPFNSRINAIAVQPDDKIVVAGNAGSDFAVVRLLPTGALDESFGGGDGIVTTNPDAQGASFALATGLALGPGGTIVIAGLAAFDLIPDLNFAVVRYDASGALDPSLDDDGILADEFFGSDGVVDLVVLPDGRFVVGGAGIADPSGEGGTDFMLARYNADGTQDATFGNGGRTVTDFAGGSDIATALLLQPDGSIVAAGRAQGGPADQAIDFALARYARNGVLDPTFGQGGKVRTDFGSVQDAAAAIDFAPSGKIVVVGVTRTPRQAEDFAIARYDSSVQEWVRARHVFYNNSVFDGNDPLPGASDDAAIAPDKAALLPGQMATFANYTSYSRGINGIMVDVATTPAFPASVVISARTGNDGTPADWTAAPQPAAILTRAGAGVGGSDRTSIVWSDGAIRDTWIEIRVEVFVGQALLDSDVFYFGNKPGETGDSDTSAAVTFRDVVATRNRLFTQNAAINDPYDFNRDGRVNALDVAIVRRAMAQPPLSLITPEPAPNFAQAGVTASLVTTSEHRRNF